MTRRRLALALVLASVPLQGGIASSAAAPDAACRLADLRVLVGPELSEKTGQHSRTFVFRNRRDTACTLLGYPSIQLLNDAGDLLPFVIGHRGDQMVTGKAPHPVRLARGGAAIVAINQYRCDLGYTRRQLAFAVRLGLPGHDTAHVTLRGRWATVIAYCGKGDPGSLLSVSPFEPTLAAATSR